MLCDPPRFCFRQGLACEVCDSHERSKRRARSVEIGRLRSELATLGAFVPTSTHRDQMIRLVVSQQWGVMMQIALLFDAQNHAKEVARKFLHGNEVTDAYWLGADDTETEVVRTMMEIPCAVDVVDGLL